MTAPLTSAPSVDPVLAVALVRAGASPAVALAASQRFRDWRASPGALARTVAFYLEKEPRLRLRCPDVHPSPEHAARAIVAGCIEAERRGTLERPCVEGAL